MGDLTKNFSRSEFACKCKCGFDTIDFETVTILQKVADHFDKPVKVTSGARCFHHNKKVGGKPSSQHLKGRAADIQVSDTEPADVYEFLNSEYPDRLGLGKYNSFTHIDTRKERARW